ncbi:MarR family winged helix-turn-helix transcriptional regulator [Profundibacterium mesophilum]|uniref:5'-methylthioadenosine phosphorylase n=1 Tax=Profundibacterium mesophilum KAUST100406-0324 TaxID=1037889 RepID=A0A921TD81_9RHOB|nr:MarR family transcriptional regulator [Profundibacterium mesophilum]KAF0676513.1 5'-methylthioadenosine phosphorylase [Profundibacterium mesophilum KAUST100406-0324]
MDKSYMSQQAEAVMTLSDATSSLALEDQLCFALYSATNAITRSYRPLLDELGLTYPQYLVMLVLWDHDSLPIARIAAKLKLASNAIGPLVERLQEKGLASRTPDQHDRRVMNVAATQAGQALKARAGVAQAKVVCRTTLDPEEFATLRGKLVDLVTRMELSDGMEPDETKIRAVREETGRA